MKLSEFKNKVENEDINKIKERIIFTMERFLKHKRMIEDNKQKNFEAYFKYKTISKEEFEKERDRLNMEEVENKAEIRLLKYLVQFEGEKEEINACRDYLNRLSELSTNE